MILKPDRCLPCEKETEEDRFSRRLFGLIYPTRCVFCGKLIEVCSPEICDACEKTLPKPPEPRKSAYFSACISALPYENSVREAILRMKMGARHSCIPTFSILLTAQIRKHLDGQFDLITWVPPSALHRAKRGYDQNKLLAKAIARELQVPVASLLRKVKLTKTQSSLKGYAERRHNVQNAFRPIRADMLCGRRILLIDDVITTGATLSECSRVLRAAGAFSVVCATIASTTSRQ